MQLISPVLFARDLAVLRSPWDYAQHPAEFAAWLEHAGTRTRVLNEPELIRFPGVVPKIPGHEGRVAWVGPDLGEHTGEILHELGYDAEAVGNLAEKGVVRTGDRE